MDVSICIATYNKPQALEKVLWSIVEQSPGLAYEVIIVDDGSPTVETEDICRRFKTRHELPLRYFRTDYGEPHYGNPARARNTAYRVARAPVIIAQSDDVVHGPDAIQILHAQLLPGTFVVAHVQNTDWNLEPKGCGHPKNPNLVELCGPRGRRPLFFLGAVYRDDVFAIGGNDPRFRTPGREDVFFVECLRNGLGLKAVFSQGATGSHLHHDRPPSDAFNESHRVYTSIRAEGVWRAKGAPWPLEA